MVRPGRFVPPFAYEALVRGELALARGDLDAAVAAFELATAAPDEDPYLLARLAFAQALQGAQEAAEASLAHAEQLDPCSEAVWLTRGELSERAGSFEQAGVAYANAGRCAPQSELPVLGLARVLERRGQDARALSVLGDWSRGQDTRAQHAAFELAIALGDEQAIEQAIDALATDMTARATQLERAVRKTLEQARPRLAARLLAHAPGAIPPALVARVHLATGDVDRARALLSTKSAQELGSPIEAAELFLSAGLDERAELSASDALSRVETRHGYLLRAEARRRLGRSALAIDDLRAANHSPEAKAALARLSRELALDVVAQALQ